MSNIVSQPALAGRFIDFHVLQSVPYANLNRDDTNSVKTVQYGDRERTRVSSQCWKRAVRRYFQRSIGDKALRTRRIVEAVEAALRDERGWPADLARRAGQHIATGSSIKADPPSEEEPAWSTNAMVYVPASAVTELADLAETHRVDIEGAKDMKKGVKSVLAQDDIDAVLRRRNGIINLFGRMLAEVDGAGVDGAVQLAHALTTHGTDVEVDYFAAVDDITDAWRDTTGSAHMGSSEFSAGVFYRYATLDLADLMRNIGGDVEAARSLATSFGEAFVLSLPEAKKTSTAPHTIPDLVHISVRADRPLSYAAAFERPVGADRAGGFAQPSRRALADYAQAAGRLLGQRGLVHAGWASLEDKDLTGLGARIDSFDDLITGSVTAALSEATA
ncbi:type I-E CRISPR-associated protein Cas7/Cse4/CasC [Streptomyces lydicus]|uniref:type I-E CRISPR-associated protein Cas7/Cse4/CasC n=1 Tax=Streptomyces lydicus TaxID=47763 RepID=UPI0005258921|nr:type I-E CRISPR-associated protein Cas7/Cse4/CasC [Streptomyces lydicus]MDC7341081.1 type I-E CRISPR-associated protein Cas7/Cse4/CasC [Streptomyces lydicus]UEG89235.1 type I-E CRISPR-associated protein Cas7/Cse4/CasC [Streptomyces lydicus]